jgi:polyketide synthase PksM
VVQESRPWAALRDGSGRELPRRAGVSSFGFGGVNAHLVIEEYPEPAREAVAVSPVLVVLSAKNEARLGERVSQLLSAIETRPLVEADLAAMAYTLQVGREAMAVRLGFLADSMAEVQRKLKAYLESTDGAEELYRGEVKRDKMVMALTADEDMLQTLEAWVTKGKYGKLLELWVQGLPFDWSSLYGENKPHRISLPSYPFAQERYWVPELVGKVEKVDGSASGDWLHPLLHRNTSNLWGQRFNSRFNGDEFFLADHVVDDLKLLPDAAYLELVRAAVMHSAGSKAAIGIRLENVAWLRPLVVEEQPLDVHIGLYPQDDGAIGYEVYDGIDEKNNDQLVIYAQGRAVLEPQGESPILDLETLRKRCDEQTVSGDVLYHFFHGKGLKYGPAQQGVEHLTIGKDAKARPEVLGRLVLPKCVMGTQADYALHPSIMDAALQALVGLSWERESANLSLPFSVEAIRIWSDTPERGWAWIRYSTETSPGDDPGRFDIDLCDDTGQICVRLTGYTAHVMDDEGANADVAVTLDEETSTDLETGLYLVTPVWDVVDVAQNSKISPAPGEHTLIIGGTSERCATLRDQLPDIEFLEIGAATGIEEIKQHLERLGEIDHILWLAPERVAASLTDQSVIEAQEEGTMQCFHLLKALLALGYEHNALSWTLITTQTQGIRPADALLPAHGGIHGFMGSLAKEYRHWKIRLVDLPREGEWPLKTLLHLPPDPEGETWGYRDGKWYRQSLLPSQLPEVGNTRYRKGGVYVVIGGAGGIGEVWSEYMIQHYAAQIVWIGRRALDATIETKQERLSKLGPRPLYLSADASNNSSMVKAYSRIREQYGSVHGVIHGASVLEQNNLMQMSESSFRAVLAAKVNVSVVMAQVFSDEALDFVLFFSSLESFIALPGMANYAAGYTFKDAFAQALDQVWPCPVRIMNWCCMGQLGIAATPEYRTQMLGLGIEPIEPDEGMTALEILLGGDHAQLGLMKFGKPISEKCNALRKVRSKKNRLSTPKSTSRDDLLKQVQVKLIQAVSELLKISPEEINLERELSEYGFDSISITQFTHELNLRYGLELLPTVGIDHPSLASLADHLVESHGENLATHLMPPSTTTVIAKDATGSVASRIARYARRPHNESVVERQLSGNHEGQWLATPVRKRFLEVVESSSLQAAGNLAATLDDCSQAELKNKAEPSRWFVLRKSNQSAKIKLFCLPYGVGGGASIFHQWQNLLDDDVEVCPIQLPGKENRFKEQPFNDLETCVDTLCEVLVPELDRPYVFYGHSAGGLIAYRLALKLNQNHECKPHHLFVGAYPSPSIQPNPIIERMRQRFAEVGVTESLCLDLLNAPETEQLKYIEVMTSVLAPLHIKNELGKAWLPSFIADMNMLQSYTWEETSMDLPVSVFHGVRDEVVSEEDMMTWRVLTSGPFAYKQVPGDHLFIREEVSQHILINHIKQYLS